MNKKIVFTIAMCVPAVMLHATNMADSLDCQVTSSEQQALLPLEPTYLEYVTEAANWGSNWFLDVKGGASVFLGNPLGCSDLFGRMEPVLQVGLGKWFMPAVGGRVVYQGFEFKDAKIQTQKYNNVHADLMYNLTNRYGRDENILSRWDIIPYLGAGIIQQKGSGRKPFAMHYGVMGRYRVCKRLHIAAELGGMTTFREFDGMGAGNKFGDNMLNLSLGVTYTIGRAGWKKVVDAKPYMQQNSWLTDYVNALHEKNTQLARRSQEDKIALAEYRKILEIEGLLTKYQDRLPKLNKPKSLYPRNDYSGLNSLRERLANRKWDGNPNYIKADTVDMKQVLAANGMATTDTLRAPALPAGYATWNDYLNDITAGKVGIGAPVYFFFQLGKDILTDSSQLINLDELVRIAQTYNLKVKVSGAADSATGTATINDGLSRQRADYLAKMMQDRGIAAERIHKVYEGGINTFTPIEANRNSCVVLTL